MKYSEFRDELEKIVCGQKKAVTTEEYLRKLLGQLIQHQKEKPSSELFLEIFRNALDSEPIKIMENWVEIKEPRLFSSTEDLKTLGISDFDYTCDAIKFFVSDLKRMEEKELKDPLRGYGVTSPSGARWCNFTMCGFVDASFALLNENNDAEMDKKELPWYYIASILIVGKIYE